MASEQFSVSWENFHKNLSLGMNSLLENEDFVDVTLAVEKRYLKAHQIVLSVCSPYFRELFKTSPCKHPIIFMKDVSFVVMNDLLQFMYQGEVQVSEENFVTFIKTAESLQIRGLSDYENVITESPELERSISQNSVPNETHQNALKKTRLNKPTALIKHDTIKTEQETETTSTDANEEESIILKTEPFDQEPSLAIVEDNSNENFYKDPIEVTNVDDWMMEGGDDEPRASSSKNTSAKGEQDEIEEEFFGIPADPLSQTVKPLLPKSRKLYEKAYADFMKWCKTKDIKEYTENVMLAYFSELSQLHKASSIWSYYSKVKSTMLLHKNVDIGKFTKLVAFLKAKSGSYKPKRSKILSRDQVLRFLKEAPDDIYLMTKVAAIMGIAGALRCQELLQISVDDIEDEGTTLFVNIKSSGRSFHVWNPKDIELDFIQLYRKYLSLRPVIHSHRRFFIFYKNGKCSSQVVGKNSLGKIPATIAAYLKLPDPKSFTGHCLRRSSATY